MRLSEALKTAAQPGGERTRHFHLLCGYEPLHMATFVRAHLRQRFAPDDVVLRSGLYGDLEGNIGRARLSGDDLPSSGGVVFVEWSDFDPRLGFRGAAGWTRAALDDILTEVAAKADRLAGAIGALAGRIPIVVVSPTLPLPPLTHLSPLQAGAFDLRLERIAAVWLERVADFPGVRVLSTRAMTRSSPAEQRHDLKMELQTGFPYTLAHADALAAAVVGCLFPESRKKGLITDLDQTLWKGVLGDAGVVGVSWSLDLKSQVHALYQQLLASLAESGVLLAIASKNDPGAVATALSRPDLLVTAQQIFPIEAGWGPKSDAVGRILRTWNVGEDSVVFVDDSPMELAEVAEKHPGIECLQFHPGDPQSVLSMLEHLRERFGKQEIGDEDLLRLESLRATSRMAAETAGATENHGDFLARLQAKLAFEIPPADDKRTFELVNKTNQFNLNGRRFLESEWRERANRPDNFVLTISYEDRFGPLGKIGVVSGSFDRGGTAVVDVWVMSCRAFSRGIESRTLHEIFKQANLDELCLSFVTTERNGPFRDFLRQFLSEKQMNAPGVRLKRSVLEEVCPKLLHEVTVPWIPFERN